MCSIQLSLKHYLDHSVHTDRVCLNTVAVRMQNCVSKKGYCSESLATHKTVCIMSEIAAYCITEE